MTIINVNMEIVQRNIAYAAFMLWGVTGTFILMMVGDTIAAIPSFSWESVICCDLIALIFAIATAFFAFKFMKNHDELKALVKNQEETS